MVTFSVFCTARLHIWYIDLLYQVPHCRRKIFHERGVVLENFATAIAGLLVTAVPTLVYRSIGRYSPVSVSVTSRSFIKMAERLEAWGSHKSRYGVRPSHLSTAVAISDRVHNLSYR